jgi:hypothetical protein
MAMAGVAPSIFLFLENSFFLFDSRPVFLVLLVFVDEVAGGNNFEATEDDHLDELFDSSCRQLKSRWKLTALWRKLRCSLVWRKLSDGWERQLLKYCQI